MFTVPEATEKIVKRSRYLSEALSKDIINISSLARYIKPEIESLLIKEVSLSAIIMALKRLKGHVLPDTPYNQIFGSHPEITVKTNLALLVSESQIPQTKRDVTSGISPSGTIILGNRQDVFENVEDGSKLYYPVSTISILVPKEAINTPGIYYFFIKSLAWERINILHTFTTPKDFVIVVDDKDTERTLGVLKSLIEEIS
jgi:hypothetical protein